jgi:hypothetical protein
MELSGKIKAIGAEQQVSPTFKKRELVVETDEQYPQSIMIEFVQDKADLLNGLTVGQNVTVGINLGGREWVNPQGETKYFNSIKGWRIEKGIDTNDLPAAAKVFNKNAPLLKGDMANQFNDAQDQDFEDDLPF